MGNWIAWHIARSWSGISTPKYIYQTKQKQATVQQKVEAPQTKEISIYYVENTAWQTKPKKQKQTSKKKNNIKKLP